MSLYGAGGVSSLPAIHGLADDRIRIQVDGMDLVAACPNHMNSALSYIDPTKVGSVTVFAGITPVSVGGDSIGGTIQVKSAPPEFADAEEGTLDQRVRPASSIAATAMPMAAMSRRRSRRRSCNLSYSGSSAQADNYAAGKAFKAAGPGTPGGEWLAGNVVGSTAYHIDESGYRVCAAARKASAPTEHRHAACCLRGIPEPAHGHDRQQQHAGQPALHGAVPVG